MPIRKSIFGEKWGNRIANSALKIAALAGYEAGKPTITRRQQSRYNSNPNSVGSQIERVHAAFNAEWLAKNSPMAIGYLGLRSLYCTPQGWQPNTGDAELNQEIKEFLEEQWESMGINSSMYEAFARCYNVELPARGDSALVWMRDESRLRLMEIAADQIGEQYTFTSGRPSPVDGLSYFAGMYFDRYGIRKGFQFYERGHNQIYKRIPEIFPESDVLYLSDNLFAAIRGITKFHGTISSLTKSDQLFDYGLDAAKKQAKTGIVVRNEQGSAPDEYSYETRVEDERVIYIERDFEGAATEYQYNGDSYEVIKTEAPGDALINGCRYADERSCQSLAIPYSFLVSARFDGGAGYRGDVNKASKEFSRISRLLESPFKKIAYVTIMDGYDRGVFGKGIAAKYLKNLTRGTAQFPTAPTADAFRETQDDIRSNRAGIESRQRILGRYREDWSTIKRELGQEAMDIEMETQDRNRELLKRISPIDGKPYEPNISIADIAQNSDNPAKSAQAESQFGSTEQKQPPSKTTDNPQNVTRGALAGFDESKVQRDEDGKFSDGSGGGGGVKPSEGSSRGGGGDSVSEGGDSKSKEKSEKKEKKTPEQKAKELDDRWESAMEEKSADDQSAFRSARKDGVAIPPAWNEVTYHGLDGEKGDGLKLASGTDAKGRRQSVENKDARQKISDTNNDRISKDLTPRLDSVRETLSADAANGSEEAKVLYLISQSGFRIGGKTDGKAKHEAFGASSLMGEHVKIDGDKVTFDFTGKEGIRQVHSFTGDLTITEIANSAKPGQKLFNTNAVKVLKTWQNDYNGKKVHDIRHSVASELARKEIDKVIASGVDLSDNEVAKSIKSISETVGKKLGNNPAQALSTYIDPKLWTTLKRS